MVAVLETMFEAYRSGPKSFSPPMWRRAYANFGRWLGVSLVHPLRSERAGAPTRRAAIRARNLFFFIYRSAVAPTAGMHSLLKLRAGVIRATAAQISRSMPASLEVGGLKDALNFFPTLWRTCSNSPAEPTLHPAIDPTSLQQ